VNNLFLNFVLEKINILFHFYQMFFFGINTIKNNKIKKKLHNYKGNYKYAIRKKKLENHKLPAEPQNNDLRGKAICKDKT
jgi:hypothetical protein